MIIGVIARRVIIRIIKSKNMREEGSQQFSGESGQERGDGRVDGWFEQLDGQLKAGNMRKAQELADAIARVNDGLGIAANQMVVERQKLMGAGGRFKKGKRR